MSIATLTSKGQVTIPKPVREALRLTTGDRIEFVDVGNGRFELIAATRDVTELRGVLGPATATVTTKEMDKAVAEAVVDRYHRTTK
ncbi:MAG: AbrB/MazE/SpoVT family DNA-binding domain-containing protein [Gammaproteobacteria bacterium]|nr:AbrB/MazE/SpoVT family DNA-binding domain-containing protein [Gammaproteobacteria bacterium]MBU2477514.1 AbrB/MazE/SpoVT family DNA-binding domain-containing protein [Gammaproteobacteria bacterium]